MGRATMASRAPLHILVVDWDKDVLEVTMAMLEYLGYRTRGETESAMALRAFSGDPYRFDLAIVEPMMPEVNGIGLAARFRRIRSGFPVMFYSGCIESTFAKTIEAAGVGPVVLRPVRLRELRKAVKGAMHMTRVIGTRRYPALHREVL
jgi:two-component system, OmpR family, response regulator